MPQEQLRNAERRGQGRRNDNGGGIYTFHVYYHRDGSNLCRQGVAMTGLKGTQIDDVMLMNNAMEEFKERFTNKFMTGILEHNPDGDKGMVKMSIDEKIKEAKNEVLDLWAYLHAMEYYYGSKKD